MNIHDSYRSRPGLLSALLLIYGIVFCTYSATAADRTVLGELFGGDA